MTTFDIVIPLGPNEMPRMNYQLEYTRKNVVGYHKVYIACFNKEICKAHIKDHTNLVFIDDSEFPFSHDSVSKLLLDNKTRVGWYFQQLVKLTIWKYFPQIQRRYLVIDADTFFVKPTHFIDDTDGKIMFGTSKEKCNAYFKHMTRLHSSLVRANGHSGVCHHMMFDVDVLETLFEKVETHHKVEFWVAFLQTIDPVCIQKSGASEYNIFFHYAMKHFPDRFKSRELVYKNGKQKSDLDDTKNDYVSFHWYNRIKWK